MPRSISRRIRSKVGRFLIFHTKGLPKSIGVPLRRYARHYMFSK
jgi:hypothetical protein